MLHYPTPSHPFLYSPHLYHPLAPPSPHTHSLYSPLPLPSSPSHPLALTLSPPPCLLLSYSLSTLPPSSQQQVHKIRDVVWYLLCLAEKNERF
ncbi:velvet complex subunit 2-like [Penaeus japonicus]|uniref:velvet complex subunit 2-like n=1 Tax=Penaeus japonicus TaxID=27405 RepID=UPI001C7142CD|nr:velvet complex subunit 2-like [Penaeus japonicus]